MSFDHRADRGPVERTELDGIDGGAGEEVVDGRRDGRAGAHGQDVQRAAVAHRGGDRRRTRLVQAIGVIDQHDGAGSRTVAGQRRDGGSVGGEAIADVGGQQGGDRSVRHARETARPLDRQDRMATMAGDLTEMVQQRRLARAAVAAHDHERRSRRLQRVDQPLDRLPTARRRAEVHVVRRYWVAPNGVEVVGAESLSRAFRTSRGRTRRRAAPPPGSGRRYRRSRSRTRPRRSPDRDRSDRSPADPGW